MTFFLSSLRKHNDIILNWSCMVLQCVQIYHIGLVTNMHTHMTNHSVILLYLYYREKFRVVQVQSAAVPQHADNLPKNSPGNKESPLFYTFLSASLMLVWCRHRQWCLVEWTQPFVVWVCWQWSPVFLKFRGKWKKRTKRSRNKLTSVLPVGALKKPSSLQQNLYISQKSVDLLHVGVFGVEDVTERATRHLEILLIQERRLGIKEELLILQTSRLSLTFGHFPPSEFVQLLVWSTCWAQWTVKQRPVDAALVRWFLFFFFF